MSEPSTPTPHATNALLEILYKRADMELEEKLTAAGQAFKAVVESLGRPHMIQVYENQTAGEAIHSLRSNLFSALKDRNRQAYVEGWMDKNNQVLAMLREFENQQG